MAQSTLVVVSDQWMPYYGENGTRDEGYAVDVLRAIFEPKGWTVEYKELPWQRALDDMRNGHADITISKSKEETPDFIFSTQTLGKNAMCFYTNRPDWKFTGPDSLDTVKTGLVQGYGYRDWFLEKVRRKPHLFYSLHGNDAFPRLVSMLKEDRIQALPGNQAVVDYYIQTNQLLDQVFFAGCVDDPEQLYFAISPANPLRSKLLVTAIDKGLATMRVSGQLNYLLIKYNLKHWVPVKADSPSAPNHTQ
ncbi:substrate-binding periplasmic protein [Pseudodesulfovibrio sediminis]|nr:transporter substrate-binding domain-containing protein [Pseudodesulfovibrio sediminis]